MTSSNRKRIHSDSPAESGFILPPEWAPHWGTWLSWPTPSCDSFRARCPEIYATFRDLVAVLAEHEQVFINVNEATECTSIRDHLQLPPHLAEQVHCYHHPTNEPWCRDHGPVFVRHTLTGEKAIVDWGYNAWGGKYPPYDADNAIPARIAQLRGVRRFEPEMILEGGSIETNGNGLLLTTESCLLNPNRNPHLSQVEIEHKLRSFLGVSDIFWLGDGIVGDDTDGHVDDMTRFANERTIVTAIEDDPQDENFKPLRDNRIRLESIAKKSSQSLEIVELPMPSPVIQEGLRLPASYANFYIANNVVVMPTFNDPNDDVALEILSRLFPQRTVIGIDSTIAIWGLGSFHCLTQQEPLGTRDSQPEQ